MYQKYRVQKKRKPAGPKILAVLFAIAILGAGLWYLPKMGKKIEEKEINNIPTTGASDSRYVGKKVALSGDITPASNQINYSHTLTLEDKSTIYLISSSLDLNGYNGFVYIQGTVSKFDGKNFIVDVGAIGRSLDDLQTMSLPTSTNSRIIPDLALKIDLKDKTNISYSNSGNSYYFQVEGLSGSMKLDGFRCEAGFPGKDCDNLIKTYTGGTFVNAGGMTFYKGATEWLAINSAGAGYRISSDSDTLLYKASTALIPLNEVYIKTLLPSIQKLCNNAKSTTPTSIQKETISSWKVGIPTCNVRVTFTDAGENISLIDVQGVSTGDTTTPTTPDTQTPTSTNNTSSAPTTTASGFTFNSSRGGYSITFPSAKISYVGINVQEDLGVKGLSCYVRLDVKDYKDMDNDAIGAAVVIYECTSKLPSNSLKVDGYAFKTNTDGTKLFFIKALNPARSDFASKITIK